MSLPFQNGHCTSDNNGRHRHTCISCNRKKYCPLPFVFPSTDLLTSTHLDVSYNELQLFPTARFAGLMATPTETINYIYSDPSGQPGPTQLLTIENINIPVTVVDSSVVPFITFIDLDFKFIDPPIDFTAPVTLDTSTFFFTLVFGGTELPFSPLSATPLIKNLGHTLQIHFDFIPFSMGADTNHVDMFGSISLLYTILS